MSHKISFNSLYGIQHKKDMAIEYGRFFFQFPLWDTGVLFIDELSNVQLSIPFMGYWIH